MLANVFGRDAIVDIARKLKGTPFKDGLCAPLIGCDCAGLLEIILKEIGQEVPKRGTQNLKAALLENLIKKPLEAAIYGDVILFQNPHIISEYHCAILTKENTIIHSHWSRGITENTFGHWFRSRAIMAFSFRDIE